MEKKGTTQRSLSKKRLAIYVAAVLGVVALSLLWIFGKNAPGGSGPNSDIVKAYGSDLNYYLYQRRQDLNHKSAEISADDALTKIKALEPADFAVLGDNNPYLELAITQNDLDLVKVLADKIKFEDGDYCVNAVLAGLKNGDASKDSVNYLLNQIIGCREKGLFRLVCDGDLDHFKTLYESGTPNLTIVNPDGEGLSDVALRCRQDALLSALAQMGAPAVQAQNHQPAENTD